MSLDPDLGPRGPAVLAFGIREGSPDMHSF